MDYSTNDILTLSGIVFYAGLILFAIIKFSRCRKERDTNPHYHRLDVELTLVETEQQAIELAMSLPTLLDAQVYIARWEHMRSIDSNNPSETNFTYLLEKVTEQYMKNNQLVIISIKENS